MSDLSPHVASAEVDAHLQALDDAVTALDASGADGVMIGRGAYGRPWLPRQIAHRMASGAIVSRHLAEKLAPG